MLISPVNNAGLQSIQKKPVAARNNVIGTIAAEPVTVSSIGRSTFNASRWLNHELNNMEANGESTGDSLKDLAEAFGRIQHMFNPPRGGESGTSSSAAERFVSGEMFSRGEMIFYDDRYWEVLQDFTHNGDQNWRPGLAHSLFAERERPQTPWQYCQGLHNAFINMARLLFADGERNETSFIFSSSYNPNGELKSHTFGWESPTAQNTNQKQADAFSAEFFRHVYTAGHEEAFQRAISI